MMHIPRHFASVVIVLLIILIICIRIIVTGATHASWQEYVALNLANLNIAEDVHVGDSTYRVADGAVFRESGDVSSLQQERALRLALAVSFARRSPLFDMAGTDPTRLSTAADELESATAMLADIQDDSRNARAIRSALYPTAFLKSLARLESARLSLLENPTEDAALTYDVALRATIKEGQRGVREFSHEYTRIVDADRARFALLNGVLTKEHSLSVLSQIQDGFDSAELVFEMRRRCIRGNITSCDLWKLSEEYPEYVTLPKDAEQSVLSTIVTRREMFGGSENGSAAGVGYAFGHERGILALSKSACLADMSPVYLLAQTVYDKGYLEFTFVNDIYVQILRSNTGPVLDWYKEKGIETLFYNPLLFYTCPSEGKDISRATALMHIRDTFRATPGEPDPLEVTYEDEAIERLSRIDPDDRTLEAWLMLKDNSAGLEHVVIEIVNGAYADLRMRKLGIPVDLSAHFLFSVRSGFYTLFLAHNPSGLSGVPNPYDEHTTADLLRADYRRFSEFVTEASRQEIIEDISFFFRTHRPLE